MRAPPTPDVCPSCRSAAVSRTWRRRLPGHARLQVCETCSSAFRSAARDRSHGMDDEPRLAQLFARLAGEVWEEGDQVYWFDGAMAPNLTALTGEPYVSKNEYGEASAAKPASPAPVTPSTSPSAPAPVVPRKTVRPTTPTRRAAPKPRPAPAPKKKVGSSRKAGTSARRPKPAKRPAASKRKAKAKRRRR